MENRTNIQYLLLGEFEDAERRGWHGVGWYFWDEADGQYCYGPYPTYVSAFNAMNEYSKNI